MIDPQDIDWKNVGESDIQLRQKPGDGNSLGLVKFIFPNPYNVYLHDTPADNLFAKLTRDFSHGCVRVEKPQELAEYVLRDQPEWTPDRIQRAMHAGAEKHVVLKEPYPFTFCTLRPGSMTMACCTWRKTFTDTTTQ